MTLASLIALVCLGLWQMRCGSVNVDNLDPDSFDSTGNTNTSESCSGVLASFSTNVVAIFSSEGCVSSGCHGNGSQSGQLSLDANSGGVSQVFTNVTSNNRVDTSSPSASKLLRKPLGLDNHGGQKQFNSVEDVNYTTMFCWIQGGAKND